MQISAFALVDTTNIPLYRQYFHDKIDAEQMACDKIDGKVDHLMRIGNNEEVNFRMTDNLFRKIDELQTWVEANDKIEKNNDKVRLLGYIEQELRLFKQAHKKREVPVTRERHVKHTEHKVYKPEELEEEKEMDVTFTEKKYFD